MAKQTINPGTAPTGAGGDTFRSGSAKLQANDDELYNYLGDGTNLNKLGTAAFKNTGTQAGNVMEVGAFGLGINNQNITTDNANSLPNGFYDMNLFPGAPSQYGSAVRVIGDSGNWLHNIYFPANSMAPSIQSKINQMPWTGFNEFLVKGRNVITDANGFIKAASPIVQLFADRITANDEAKLQEITFEKLGVGDYLVKGSLGFAQQGWYVETPKDANGNVLFSVIYTTLENGDISVKTYKKKFDLETASIVADLENPVDITEKRWIDLRLQELPQPEIEVTDDPE
ncbi:phage tail fiber protein [Acinetobacter lwoffii]|uniref:phage tail fiber protein n=1 Tax=Acinetobacter lwoffii TaxID=28090 RepID=UPI002DC04C92|nr:phage tail protein [Acinetobacter lwoffii]MEB6679911.1 phage tail protein [Acinetobacter lwoffii]